MEQEGVKKVGFEGKTIPKLAPKLSFWKAWEDNVGKIDEYEKILNTQSVQIKSQEDCAKYGKAGIKGDMLTTDSNGDGNSVFK